LILTNKKQWNKKLYGSFLRFADFIPADMEWESLVEKARQKVNEGYSIMIFPEGTRSDSGKIKRFHKGAFYLANELELDLLPVVIHGANQVLSKNEFFLKRGVSTTLILPRINLAAGNYGNDIRQQAKNVLAYYRREYEDLQKKVETPDYCRKPVIKNYIYKGPILEWYLKVKARLEDNYNLYNDLIPDNCVITDLGCGHGFVSYLLNRVSPGRQVLAIDYDEDKIAIARNCAIKNDNTIFIHEDINDYSLSPSDVFILNDVLHYMPVDQQVETIHRCILKLNNSGMILIRDADRDLSKKHKATRLTELFSTGTGFNKTVHKLHFISRMVVEDIASKYKLKLEVIPSSKMTSNVLYILRN
jgi:SAM-dependent methyltransferase